MGKLDNMPRDGEELERGEGINHNMDFSPTTLRNGDRS